jgi:hypothetical protein
MDHISHPYVESGFNIAEFVILTAVFMKSSVFWDTTPCSPLKADVSEENIASIFEV